MRSIPKVINPPSSVVVELHAGTLVFTTLSVVSQIVI